MERDFPPLYPAVDSRDFNSHAHVERDGIKLIYIRPLRDFNSHAHVERDQSAAADVMTDLSSNFNSHAHVERDSGVSTQAGDFKAFQLTRSRGA